MLTILKNYCECECEIIKMNEYIYLQEDTYIYFLTLNYKYYEICLFI